jgi:two-component system sensor histidine kinase/response regulator
MNNLPKKIKILYVDDEANNLTAFQASFRRTYEIYTATSAAEGINILNENQVNVIIADQRMPVTTGVEFFNIVRAAFPDPIRILLTGYSDIEAVINAVNKGEIYRYIQKPWNEFDLQTAIQNAYEIYATRQQLKNKIHELEKANDELNRFVYSTSHDLRSPLASVMGILNLAKMEASVVDPNNYLGMIESCVKRMDAFILKIIEYYKSIRVEEDSTAVQFDQLLDDAVEMCRMQNPNIDFQININQPVEYRGDIFRLAVILNNLISNAVKYQKPDERNPVVKLDVDVTAAEVVIRIEDNGIGILHEHLNNIFKIFFRSNHSVDGLGIGLYIVKEALTRIGGEINVDSEYGKGTVFTLIVPNKAKAPVVVV